MRLRLCDIEQGPILRAGSPRGPGKDRLRLLKALGLLRPRLGGRGPRGAPGFREVASQRENKHPVLASVVGLALFYVAGLWNPECAVPRAEKVPKNCSIRLIAPIKVSCQIRPLEFQDG